MTANHLPHPRSALKSRVNWVLLGFLAIAAFFLFTEHRAHLLGVLPLLLLAACPLLHLFLHGGHGGGHEEYAKDEPRHPRRAQP
jgi:hypothetical protein